MPHPVSAPSRATRSHLLPCVRDRTTFELLTLQFRLAGEEDPGPPAQPLAEHLAVGLIHAVGDTLEHITDDMLESWGVSFDEALAGARDGLWRISNERFEQPLPGLYVSPWRDGHDCSCLFLHDLIWQLKVKGDHVALVPNCNALLVTGSDDEPGLLGMARLARNAILEPVGVSGNAVRLSGNHWEPFMPPPHHPAHAAFRTLRAISVTSEYTQQKDLLDLLYAKTGEGYAVAEVQQSEADEAGELSTATVWPERPGATLLPRTDGVFFGEPNSDELDKGSIVEWEVAQRVVGELMTPMGIYPERYLVSRFPSVEQMKAIRAAHHPA